MCFLISISRGIRIHISPIYLLSEARTISPSLARVRNRLPELHIAVPHVAGTNIALFACSISERKTRTMIYYYGDNNNNDKVINKK